MADNVTTQSSTLATPPASTVISTEEVTTLNGSAVTAQHVQRTAIAARTADGTAIDIPATTADGVLVNLGANNDVTVTGSVEIANDSGNAIPVTGGVAHDAVDSGNPIKMGGRAQATAPSAVADGDRVNAWFDNSGRMQVRGTIDSVAGTVQALGTVQAHGTTQALGTFQPLTGSVHVANTISGTVQTHGTSQALGTVQTHGTSQVLGTVRTMTPVYVGESFLGTTFTGAVTNGTLVPAPGAGTFVRVYDILVSGSAPGTAFVEMGDGTTLATVFLAANGGWSFNSSKGVRTRAANLDVLFNCAAGSWGVMVNYTLET